MSQALYRKYRSKKLSEIVGQDHITSLLERAIKQDKLSHAYLLTGPRGTGKTSIARILAHEITKLPYTGEAEHFDIIEIDAASNNGVDDVRDLREKALVAPAVAAKKVYIIDEVHMLSKAAFNALLKLLEEPPKHVVFILATTDFDKVPVTITSRSQRYHFNFIDEETVAKHLKFIAKNEGIKINDAALNLIAKQGGGSFRDSISLLDQMQNLADGEITASHIEAALGLATADEIDAIGQAIVAGDAKNIIKDISAVNTRGVSAVATASQLHQWMRERVYENPSLVHYFEGLIEVARANHPDVALLVTALKFADKTTPTSAKTMAQSVAAPPSIKQEIPAPKLQKSTPNQTPKSPAKPAPKPAKTAQAKSDKPAKDEAPRPAKSTPKIKDFNWQNVLELSSQNKSKSIGIYSLISKAEAELDGATLRLYVGNKFNKTKLDTSKNRAELAKILSQAGVDGLEIETVASPPPPKDEQAAKVAAIMGGGEEVDV